MAAQDGGIEATLRVLYTINTSPQYILAKSFDKHKVTTVNYGAASSSNSSPSYGRVALKPCVAAICRSSPELQPSGMRDYSLYVLDPLEDIMSRNARGSSDGVAVGMGLLSAILATEESNAATVTGTFIQCAPDEVALEVVISLRQIVTQPAEQPAYPNPQHYYGGEMPYNPHEAYLRSIGMLDPNNPMNHMMYPYAVAPAKPAAKSKPSVLDNTRAAQFPTPYIGPPKRAPGRPARRKHGENTPVVEQTPTPSISQTPTIPQVPSSSQPEGGASASEHRTTDRDVFMSESEGCTSASPVPENATPPPNSVDQFVAALKTLSSAAPAGADPLEDVQNNPALMQFLKALLQSNASSQPKPDSPTSDVNATEPTTDPTPLFSSIEPSKEPPKVDQSTGNKENIKPQRQTTTSTPLSLEDKRRLLGASSSSCRRPSASLMSSSPRNSRVISSSGSRSSVKRTSRDADAVNDLRNVKKRRVEEQVQNATTTAKPSVAMASSPTPAPNPLQNGQGYHINSGWGGLRMRADGSFSGGHPLRPAAALMQQTSTSKVVSFFRSADASATAVEPRKGPYKIPQWARGVPPPSPPARPVASKEAKEVKTRKKRTATTRIRREMESQTSDVTMATSDPVQPDEEDSASKQSDAPAPPSSAKSNTSVMPIIAHSDAPPIIARSSPIARPRRNNLSFFATSPCRPSTSARRAQPQTPSRGRSLFGSPSSASMQNDSSLFTPSPSIKTPSVGSFAANVQVRLAPSSPSPTSRKRISINNTAEFGRPLSLKTVDGDMYQDDSEGPASSLPIASDDDSMFDNDDMTVSNFSLALMNAGKKDWSSLALPPSSPLPSSSSPLMSADDLADESACDSVSPAPGSQTDASENGANGDCGSQVTGEAEGAHSKDSLLGLFDMTPSNGGDMSEYLGWQLQQELWAQGEVPQLDMDALMQGAAGNTLGLQGFDVNLSESASAPANAGNIDSSFFKPLSFDDFLMSSF